MIKLNHYLMSSALIAGAVVAQAQTLKYPAAPRVDTVDTYFGEQVPDPYRWLEDDNSAQTAKWVAEENKVTQAYLKTIPYRDKVRKRITELANYEKMGTPFFKHGYYYFWRNDGLQNQSVLYRTKQLGTQAEVVIDPNTLSKDGTVAIQNISFSKSGKYFAYIITRNGSDWNEIYVMDLSTGKTLSDHIEWAKFTGAEWLGDEGFFYSGYDKPEDAKSSKNEYHKVYFHRLGTEQSQDYVEFKSDKYPLRFYHATVIDENVTKPYILVTESDGEGGTIYVKNLDDVNPHYIKLIDSPKDEYSPIAVVGDEILFLTNGSAPMWKVVAYDAHLRTTQPVRTVIPESKFRITDVQKLKSNLLVSYLKDASTHAYLYDLQGRELSEIKLPTLGTASFSSRQSSDEVFYSFTSYTYPTSIYRFDAATGKSELIFKPKVKLDTDQYVTEQVFYPSKDGTKIPMFLIYKKGLKKDGKRPVFLYGYGGFNVTMDPYFSYSRTPFAMLDRGGICAYTNLRGGGEYGEQWHQAGTLMNKQNVFDDFIAAAEYLIKEGYTAKKKIAVNGGSNGGLLVGAVVNQRPDLFGAAVPQVGVMDMLRYHNFTIGWNWARDYGRSDDSPEMFRYLKAYSPLHNISNDGTAYPPIMITTSDHDDRVVPAHSFKYAAQLQASNTGKAPKLIRIDVNAGHGHGKPISKIIDEYTDVQSFIMWNLGVKF